MNNDKGSTSTLPIYSILMEKMSKDLPNYREEMLAKSKRLASEKIRFRKFLENKNLIKVHVAGDEGFSLNAVDSSTADNLMGEVYTMNIFAVNYRADRKMNEGDTRFFRMTETNHELLNKLPLFIRNYYETLLLCDVSKPTIADGSFWSFLMNTNQFLSFYKKTFSDKNYEICKEMFEAYNRPNDPLTKMVLNPNVIAISKSGTSVKFSKENESAENFTDLAIFSTVLEEGEYVTPKPISKALKAGFGVHEYLQDKGKLRVAYTEDMYVTFYKPHAYKKAYRIECRKEIMLSEKLPYLLSAIKKATEDYLIIEPVPQFMADNIAKTCHEAIKAYSMINEEAFNSIHFKYRT